MKTSLKAKYSVSLEVIKRAHFYKVMTEDKELTLPGVTGYLGIISKPQLLPWAKKVALESVRRELLAIGPEPKIIEPHFIDDIIARAKKRPDEEKDKAADYGTRLHEYADNVIKGLPMGDVSDDLMHSVLAFKDWVKTVDIVLGDTPVASIEHGYGGKFDAVAVNSKGEYGVIDIKTSNACYDEYALQVAAYCKAAEETFGVPFSWGSVVRFGKTSPDYEVKIVADVDKCFKAFLNAKDLKTALGGSLFL